MHDFPALHVYCKVQQFIGNSQLSLTLLEPPPFLPPPHWIYSSLEKAPFPSLIDIRFQAIAPDVCHFLYKFSAPSGSTNYLNCFGDYLMSMFSGRTVFRKPGPIPEAGPTLRFHNLLARVGSPDYVDVVSSLKHTGWSDAIFVGLPPPPPPSSSSRLR